MQLRARAGAASAITLAVAAALLAAPLDARAEASGPEGYSDSTVRSAAKAGKDRAARTGTNLTIRPGTASSAAAREAAPDVPAASVPAVPPETGSATDTGAAENASAEAGAKAAASPEANAAEQAPPAAAEQAPPAAAEQAPAAAAEQAPPAAVTANEEKPAAEPAAPEQRAESPRRPSAPERKKSPPSTLPAEVEEVLERARNDYPVLRTEEGEPILRSILQRQKVLQARGVYPRIAMVEAVADHSDTLRPRVRTQPAAGAQAEAMPDYSRTYGKCRWVDSHVWSCK